MDQQLGAGQTAYLWLSEYNDAYECVNKALAMVDNPHYEGAAHNLAGTALLGMYVSLSPWELENPTETLNKAGESYRKAIELSGDRVDIAWSNLPRVLEHQFRFRAAVEALETYLERSTNDLAAQHRLRNLEAKRDWLAQARQKSGMSPDFGYVGPLQTPDTSDLRIYGDDIQEPVRISDPNPIYPQGARRERIQGVMALGTIIDTGGRVTDVTVLRSLDDRLDKSAVEAVKQWLFEPAMKNGEPVCIPYFLTIRFQLQ